MISNCVRFWEGRDAELVEEYQRRQRQAEKESARRRAAPAGPPDAPGMGPDAAAPRTRRRKEQRSTDAGIKLPAELAGLLVPSSPAAGGGGERDARLMAEGEVFLAPAGRAGDAGADEAMDTELPGGDGFAMDWHAAGAADGAPAASDSAPSRGSTHLKMLDAYRIASLLRM